MENHIHVESNYYSFLLPLAIHILWTDLLDVQYFGIFPVIILGSHKDLHYKLIEYLLEAWIGRRYAFVYINAGYMF